MASTTFSGPVTSTNGFITPGTIVVGGNTITGTELGYVDGVTPGTAAASKALVLNASKGISTITSATITTLTSTTAKLGSIQATDAASAMTITAVTGNVSFSGGITLNAQAITTDTSSGLRIGTGSTQKIGFYNTTPVVQQATTGTTTGFTAGAGTAAKDDSTYTGGSGSKAYTVGDIVLALKNLGLLAAS